MVSIVVPVYNGEKYVASCVESLCNQSYKDIEIILINDGSADNTGRILDELKHKDDRITVIHKENGGVSSARNRGIEEASGEYLLFCDCDDAPEKEWCEELVKCSEAHYDKLPVCFIRLYVDGELSDWQYCIKEKLDSAEAYSVYGKNDLSMFLVNRLIFSPCNKLYRADIVKQNNIKFDLGESLGEDAVFAFRYIAAIGGSIVTVNKFLYNYLRQNPNGLTTKRRTTDVKSFDYMYFNFKKMLSVLDVDKKEVYDEFYYFFYENYIRDLYMCIRNKTVKKSERIYQCRKIVKMPGFYECLNEVDKERVCDKKIVKMAKSKTILFMYLTVKILLG
ncbi:MAG: glycosyltransferase family 2 protein [Clostridia bacterium]|nr:glycosyltransferase family 2 protein [Clostridia bacterium]